VLSNELRQKMGPSQSIAKTGLRCALEMMRSGSGGGTGGRTVVAELWGITDRELKEMQRSLEELG
jgi:hypothetical protein